MEAIAENWINGVAKWFADHPHRKNVIFPLPQDVGEALCRAGLIVSNVRTPIRPGQKVFGLLAWVEGVALAVVRAPAESGARPNIFLFDPAPDESLPMPQFPPDMSTTEQQELFGEWVWAVAARAGKAGQTWLEAAQA